MMRTSVGAQLGSIARSPLVPLEMRLDMTFSTLDFPADFEIQSFAKRKPDSSTFGSDGLPSAYPLRSRLQDKLDQQGMSYAGTEWISPAQAIVHL